MVVGRNQQRLIGNVGATPLVRRPGRPRSPSRTAPASTIRRRRRSITPIALPLSATPSIRPTSPPIARVESAWRRASRHARVGERGAEPRPPRPSRTPRVLHAATGDRSDGSITGGAVRRSRSRSEHLGGRGRPDRDVGGSSPAASRHRRGRQCPDQGRGRTSIAEAPAALRQGARQAVLAGRRQREPYRSPIFERTSSIVAWAIGRMRAAPSSSTPSRSAGRAMSSA